MIPGTPEAGVGGLGLWLSFSSNTRTYLSQVFLACLESLKFKDGMRWE